ncbi:HpcH/HpaI aldolase/citrate lyase family protein [Actibacterium sp. 188UL27-1]|uniref:HpcH/HpaI aldolase family protein n=1 Tax=Actibacterium sp. 188UL27-1 TaxID=2786961 RepID=UPI00195D8307|nr:aldolase/citrate lyase family protein [Actibacterium sp. 188UL27-1]MBM7067804.1 2-keto-3-deoxy-L-rhamnonate aldolase [Actibacterium sp. 188UL27-1]
MPAPHNPLKSALAQNQVQIGLWLALGNPTTTAIAAGAGYDWCLIDGDHGSNAVLGVLEQVQAMDGQGATPVVRVPFGSDGILRDVLDLGVQTVLVQDIETAIQAQKVVAACKYGPTGTRRMADDTIRAAGYGAVTDYAETADDQICVLVQIGCQTGLDNLAEIAAVDGIDGVFISAPDLCAGLGHIGKPECPEVISVIEEGIEAIRVAGKAPGIVSFKTEALKRYADQGVTFLGVGGDATTYAKAVRDLATSAAAAVQDGRGSGSVYSLQDHRARASQP